MIGTNVRRDKIHVSMRPFWSSDNIMWCVWCREAFWWVARKTSTSRRQFVPPVLRCFLSLSYYGCAHVSNHNLLPAFLNLFLFPPEIDIAQILLGLERLNQLLFEHTVNSCARPMAKRRVKLRLK